MKYIKEYKLYEAGEWNRSIDWQYVKDNPDDDSEEVIYIKELDRKLQDVIEQLDNKSIFDIIDIIGFDMYSGPYALVNIFNKRYKIWLDEVYGVLFIELFPIDTNQDTDRMPGFSGFEDEIADMLNDLNKVNGDIELYKSTKKYNL